MWPYGSGYGMMGSHGWGWGMGLLHGLFWLVILGLIVWAVVALVRSASSNSSGEPASSRVSPGLAVLEERYARGEIDREEYVQKKRDLSE